MSTESTSPRYAELDLWPTEDIALALAESQLAAAAIARAAAPAIAFAADAAAERLRDPGGRLIYVGAGTSGRLAVLDGVELIPTFGWPRERLAWLLAGGEAALTGPVENAEDDRAGGAAAVEALDPGAADVLIAVAASGRTPWALGATRAAARAWSMTIGLGNNAEAPLLDLAAYPILLDTGAEVVAGSTRMAAGTAQKIALNMLSTAIMVRLGRVWGNLMSDLSAQNEKLARRRIDITARIAGCDQAAAEAALAQTGHVIREAALVALGDTPEDARIRLGACKDHLRRALASRRNGLSPETRSR